MAGYLLERPLTGAEEKGRSKRETVMTCIGDSQRQKKIVKENSPTRCHVIV